MDNIFEPKEVVMVDEFEEVEEIVTPSDWGTSDCCY